MKPILETLSQIHDKNVIHRDISPDNIMLTEDEKLVLIDFGAAREYSSETSTSFTTILKHGYAPIEQYSPKGKQGPWTDIYALAATIYRMITGKVLSDSTARAMTQEKPFDNFKIECTRKIIKAITKALSIDRDKRYQCIGDFYEEVYDTIMPNNLTAEELLKKADILYDNKEYRTARRYYEEAIDKGSIDAIYRLGNMYTFGDGVKENNKKAFALYQKAAKLGNAWGMVWLAQMYEFGEGISKNLDVAMELYQKAAQLNNATAMWNIGFWYQCGIRVAEDYEEAAKWYERALSCEGHEETLASGSLEAVCEKLGARYHFAKHGYSQNYEKAFEWYKKAADLGSAGAMNNLGGMYYLGCSVPQDYTEAIKWYRKAADKGNANAMHNLGRMYDEGKGVPKDYAEAIKWYRKAADKGNAGAMNDLGYMYEEGQGVPQDYAEAIKWYRQSAENGDTTALNNLKRILRRIYKHGIQGMVPNYDKAVEWYQKTIAGDIECEKTLNDLLKGMESTEDRND